MQALGLSNNAREVRLNSSDQLEGNKSRKNLLHCPFKGSAMETKKNNRKML